MTMTTTTVRVAGMTCAHCVNAVTRELTALDGVQQVSVELEAGGASSVTVTSSTELDAAGIRAAIDEAGYDLVDS
jgi:copper chaperone